MSIIEIALLFGQMGLLAFGGGFTVIADLQRELVTVRGLFTEEQFATAYALGASTPGPGLLYVIPLGYQLAGIAGAITALGSFVAPTVTIAILVSRQWERIKGSPWVRAANEVLVPVSVGLMGAGLLTVARPVLGDVGGMALAVLGAAIIASRRIEGMVVVVVCGALGVLGLL